MNITVIESIKHQRILCSFYAVVEKENLLLLH